MMLKLPHSDFRWLSPEELDSFDIASFDSDGDVGAVLEVHVTSTCSNHSA